MTRLAPLLFVIGSFAVGPMVQAAVVGPTPVALSGTPSPTGSNYTAFGTPVLNASGQVAFTASLGTGPAAGIFAGNVGSLQAVALLNDAAPGGGTYTAFSSPFAMNALGQVGFTASATGGAGIFAGAPGSVQSVARVGAAAPGGSTYRTLNGFRSPVLNDAGQVAFYADLGDGSSTNNGVFVGMPGAVQLVAKTGTPASIGGTFSSFHSPVLNGAGQIAVTAGVTNGGSGGGGLFLSVSGSLQAVTFDGTAAPAGGNYHSNANFPGINSDGQVVTISFLSGGSSTEGIFAGGLGSIQTVALRGAPAPSGGNYDTFFTPIINSTGAVTFRALVGDSPESVALYEGTPGAVERVALEGDAAPGGAIFSDFTIHNAINSSGLLVFGANLSGPGVDTTNDVGMYAGTRGNLVKIVREGDIIDVDPGTGVDNRTVKSIGAFDAENGGGQDGHGPYLNDAGLFVYQLAFTDGSSGIFTTSLAALPQSADFNHDGVVDAADYITWRNGLGSPYTQSDYDVWRARFGEVIALGRTSIAPNSVPEPHAFCLLIAIAAFRAMQTPSYRRDRRRNRANMPATAMIGAANGSGTGTA